MAEWTQEERLSALNYFEARYAVLRGQERSSRAPAELLYHSIAIDLQCSVIALRGALQRRLMQPNQCMCFISDGKCNHCQDVDLLAKTAPPQ